MKPLLSVMLSLWLFVLCSSAPVSLPAMAVNCFSGESPDEIYSGAFTQLVWTRFAFVPQWRCLLTLPSDLSAPVELPVATACFSCPRSFQCTDLNSHRLLPLSSSPCPMNPLPKGITSSALLWCELGIRSGSCSSDLARSENLGFSAHDVQLPQAMESPFADSHIPLPPLAYFGLYLCSDVIVVSWGPILAASRSRQCSLSSPTLRFLKPLPQSSYHVRNHSLSTSSWQCSISVPSLRCLKLESTSPLKLSFVGKFSQISSRQGRERSFSISSFSKERILPPQSLFVRGDFLPEFKTGKHYQYPNRLLSYVMVHLGSVDATIFIPMKTEVWDYSATSHTSVTNRSLLVEFEVRYNSFIEMIASGNFDFFHKALSNFNKFVSLSLYFFEFYVRDFACWLAYRVMYDVASTTVTV